MSINFEEDQQFAIFGHALKSPELWTNFERIKLDKDWFTDVVLHPVFELVQQFRKKNGRYPNPVELVTYAKHKEDVKTAAALERTINKAYGLSKVHGLDVLSNKLKEWRETQLLKTHLTESGDRVNDNDIAGAKAVVDRLNIELKKISIGSAKTDALVSSTERLKGEKEDRLEKASRIISFGIDFADDWFGGILPNDFVLVGARSGAGKTQAVSNIARHNSANKRRVSMFALEAEEREIERRVKYQYLAERFFKNISKSNYNGLIDISYQNWIQGKLEVQFAPYYEEVDPIVEKELAYLSTYYRSNNDFNIKDLERQIIDVSPDSDLIILDHFQYVDLGELGNENSQTKKMLKMCRDLTLAFGKPIVGVSHIRKGETGNRGTIVPYLEEFHGSSDLFKIVTKALFFSKSHLQWENKYGTYIYAAKNRTAGDTDYCGLSFFDIQTNNYTEGYGIGLLDPGHTKWTQCKDMGKLPPRWAKKHIEFDVV